MPRGPDTHPLTLQPEGAPGFMNPTLGQSSSFEPLAHGPSGAMQWVAIVFVGTGWLLATTVAAGAGRVLRRT